MPEQWLKSGPGSGLDCHMCSTFIRPRHERAAPEDTLSEQLNRFLRRLSEKWLRPRLESALDWQCIESCLSANEIQYMIGSYRQQSSICVVNYGLRYSGFGQTAAEREGDTFEGFKDLCQKEGSSQGQNLAETVICVAHSLMPSMSSAYHARVQKVVHRLCSACGGTLDF